MNIKRKAAVSIAVLSILIAGCFKDPATSNRHYLKFSNAFIHVGNMQGSGAGALIESDIAWELSLEAPAPGWLSLSKLSGNNTDSLVVTATATNATGGYKFATIIASPVGDNTIAPSRLLVVQYDSTYKK